MIKYKRLVSLYRAEDPDQSSSDQELHEGKKQHGAKPERDERYPVHPASLGLCTTAAQLRATPMSDGFCQEAAA